MQRLSEIGNVGQRRKRKSGRRASGVPQHVQLAMKTLFLAANWRLIALSLVAAVALLHPKSVSSGVKNLSKVFVELSRKVQVASGKIGIRRYSKHVFAYFEISMEACVR